MEQTQESVVEQTQESVVEQTPVSESLPSPVVEPITPPPPVVEPIAPPPPVVEPIAPPPPVVEPIAPPPPITIPKSKEYNNHPENVLSSIEKTLPKPTDSILTSIVGVFNNIGEFFQLRFGSRRLVTEQGVRQTGH